MLTLALSLSVVTPVTEPNGVDKVDKSALILLSGHEKEVYGCLWNPVKNILVSGYVSLSLSLEPLAAVTVRGH